MDYLQNTSPHNGLLQAAQKNEVGRVKLVVSQPTATLMVNIDDEAFLKKTCTLFLEHQLAERVLVSSERPLILDIADWFELF